MNILSEKKLENSVVEIEIQVPLENVEQEYKRVYDKIRKNAKIDGFRKGKAPVQVIEKKYKDNAGAEVAENLAKKAFWEAVDEKKLIPIVEPRIDYDEISQSEPFKFKASIEVAPTTELGTYTGIKVEETVCTVTDENVENEINNMRERYAEVKPVDDKEQAVENGYLVKFKLKRTDDVAPEEVENIQYREYSIVVGKSKDEHTIDKHILGLKVGDEKEITITYPSDYYIDEFASKTVTYYVVIAEISNMILPEIDDEFAKKIGNESVEDLKKKTREYLERVVNDRISSDLKGGVLGAIVENSKFDIPESMILNEMYTAFQRTQERIGYKVDSIEQFAAMIGQDPKEYRAQLRGDAERTIKNTLILSEVAKKEELKVPEDKYQNAVQGYAASMGKTAEEVEKIIEQNNNRSKIEQDLILDVAMEFLVEKADVKKSKEMSFDEFLKVKMGQ